MKMTKKGNAIVLALVITATSLTGCQWLKDNWRAILTFIVEVTQSIIKLTACHGAQCPRGAGGEEAFVYAPATYRPQETLWTTLIQSVDRGRLVEGAGECSPVCVREYGGDPASPACDECRSAVGVATSATFFHLCVGRAYVLPAERVLGTVTAFTDRGVFVSQPMWAFREDRSLRYDDCGSVSQANYNLDDIPAHNFADYVRSQRATQLDKLEWQQVPTGAADDVPLIALAPEVKQAILDGAPTGLAGADTTVRVSSWPFSGGGSDPVLGPGQFDGVIMTSGAGATMEQLVDLANGGSIVMTGGGRGGFKPCWTDGDCAGYLRCRPSVDGLVCLAP